MSPESSRALVTAVLAVLTAAILALVNSWISARAGVDEELRAQRLKVYPTLWQDTKAVSRWPRSVLTRTALEQLHQTLRTWYYTEGGLFLSESARARYGDVQELIAALLGQGGGLPEHVLGENGYADLMVTTSALRTALAEDLDTRRRKSILNTWRRSRWHGSAAKKAQARIRRARAGESGFPPGT